MKRIFLIVLSLLVLSGSAWAAAFSDIPEDAWYAEAAAWCAEQSIMKGTSATEFFPDGTLTRATLATVLHRAAVVNGEHKVFELPYVTVEAVEAGYNRWHDVNECVGYVLTFRNGKKVYVTGDTSTTKQMERMSTMEIDYAFYCCDGVYNMGMEESAKCAKLVGAKHNIPYHNSTSNSGEMFDRKLAERWDAPNRLIAYPGEEIEIK